jgi:hypothetical protein
MGITRTSSLFWKTASASYTNDLGFCNNRESWQYTYDGAWADDVAVGQDYPLLGIHDKARRGSVAR